MEAATIPRERTVPFGAGEVTLRELSLRKIGTLGGRLAALARERETLKKIGSGDMALVVEGVADLMQKIPDQLAGLVTVVVDLEQDAVLDATPRQVLALLVEVWALNDLAELFKGKVQPLAAGRPPAAEPGPGLTKAPDS